MSIVPWSQTPTPHVTVRSAAAVSGAIALTHCAQPPVSLTSGLIALNVHPGLVIVTPVGVELDPQAKRNASASPALRAWIIVVCVVPPLLLMNDCTHDRPP